MKENPIIAWLEKIKDDQMWRDKIQIYQKYGIPVSKTRQGEQRQCGARSGVVDTQIFSKNVTS